ncbi:hypothetical protein GE061_011372 [Apolygus lucorum]|uniref:Uncharacterized protein n=1 Tax=Apolygus lucorum TaxID=248454 RepID=A0A6A4JVU4_APOLU|nr:hypothetical protein GE061_011372 [Apolygus lucorum]
MSQRLLKLAVECVHVIPSFQQLPVDDRDTLLEDSWKDLFILTMAQWSLPVEQDRLLRGVEDGDDANGRALRKSLSSIAAVLSKLSHLRVDHTEYACLKALVLFSPDSVEKHEIDVLQEQTLLMLSEYSGPRASKLLLILLGVSKIGVSSVIRIFFRANVNSSLVELLSLLTQEKLLFTKKFFT